jgi:hypothetical protein
LQLVAVPQMDHSVIGIAKLAGALDDSLEDRPDIGW